MKIVIDKLSTEYICQVMKRKIQVEIRRRKNTSVLPTSKLHHKIT